MTVGGSTDLIEVRDRGYERWTAVAEAGGLSPHSRTSVYMAKRHTVQARNRDGGGKPRISRSRTELLTLDSLSLLAIGGPRPTAGRFPGNQCCHGASRASGGAIGGGSS